MSQSVQKLRSYLLDLPKSLKLIISISVDVLLCLLTTWISFYLRLGELFPINNSLIIPSFISILIAIPVFYLSGLYRTIFRYSGWPAMFTVSKSIFLYGFLFSFLITIISFDTVPRTIGIIQPLLLFFAVGISRSAVRYWIGDLYKIRLEKSSLPKAVIYGAGNAGRKLLISLENNNELQVSCFLDDDEKKKGRLLVGKRIYSPEYIDFLATEKNISYLLLALPNISSKKRKEIIKNVEKYNLVVRTLPSMVDLAKGKIDVKDLIELEIDDLLGRDKVSPNIDLLRKNIKSKVVLVTGAGGSIGGQLCREILKRKPNKLLLLDSNEFSLYSILDELNHSKNSENVEIITLLSSVQDKKNINIIFRTWNPDTVYHAAAYKHVPIVEHNLSEGVKNNVFGTLNVAEASLETDVDNFVFISTDKAVRPTNVMGATKRLCEICLQALFAERKEDQSTKFSMVRFGNVLDSSGSVIPKFRKQIKERKPLTVTHLEITRFFMTIEEAAELVIQAGAMAKGGDVFVLDMGEPVKIYDLAKKMIQLSGLKLKDQTNPNGDIEILITGLRPGEKLYEELLLEKNSLVTKHPKIFKAQDKFIPWVKLEKEIIRLENALSSNDLEEIVLILENLVDGYKPSGEIVDYIFSEKLKRDSSN
ncbi:MAG: polysaccharide biosynthesis protein [Prochlorococcus marinus CUG1432]|uniref:polysaccharide biosynthesis protein n=1 Tax=Prochlorococcus marinus TaxID=1219 RepID=UPI001ADA9049|nr:nucleoside-diphosphate sugar epimerase/dehydratase [Prochlorococcus marinus]MCR8545137.1 polysaccharide biosynthesis protein [Prochlorococcus marinus CUG1432]